MTDAERALVLILAEHEHARQVDADPRAALIVRHMIETVVAEADAAEMENGR